MRTPYGLPDIESCMTCEVRPEDGVFCDMPDPPQTAWDHARRCHLYPAGAILFFQEQTQRDICVICVGRVKLFSTTPEGRTIIHRICDAGEVLGLSAALENTGYEASAETLEPCVISFINTESLRGLMKKDPEIAYRVARHLSFEVQSAWGQGRSLGTQATAMEKLSRFLISIAGPEGRIGMHLTQREVADLIGVARETVTRSLAELRRNGVVQVHGHVITTTDSDELERLATT